MDESKTLQLPQCTEFIGFRWNQIPTLKFLTQYIRPYRVPYPGDERALLGPGLTLHRAQLRTLEAMERKHELASETDCDTLARHLLSQWPLREATIEGLPALPLLNVQQALLSVKPEWERLSDNHLLSEHVTDVHNLLDLCRDPARPEKTIEGNSTQEWYRCWKPSMKQPCIIDLLFQPLKELPIVEENVRQGQRSPRAQWATKIQGIVTKDQAIRHETPSGRLHQGTQPTSNHQSPTSELEEIVSHFSRSRDPVRNAYGQDLNRSLLALQQEYKNPANALAMTSLRVDTSLLHEAISSSQKEIQTRFASIHASMISGHKWLELGGLLPVLNPLTLLETLHHYVRTKSHGTIQADILSYGASIVNLQHLLRIRNAHQQADKIQLANEFHNIAHTSWKIEEHVDWLLLEIDFNLIIREDQQQVAQAMIASPNIVSNFVLQMNMGQGKSSVIIPMVATALAKDENLVRVVVPRSLLLQAAQLMSSRLGGLINRKIKHIPFSRKSPTDLDSIKAYHKLHSDIHKDRGVLLALPEHLLSFQLSGLQELSNW
ncbi:MAG: hypothetical protein Q9224_006075 [Gallowayella concinna]